VPSGHGHPPTTTRGHADPWARHTSSRAHVPKCAFARARACTNMHKCTHTHAAYTLTLLTHSCRLHTHAAYTLALLTQLRPFTCTHTHRPWPRHCPSWPGYACLACQTRTSLTAACPTWSRAWAWMLTRCAVSVSMLRVILFTSM